MGFRFDMKGKTPQQQIIVAKRDAEKKRRQEEAAKKKAESKISDDVHTSNIILAINKEDPCPKHGDIIMRQQCSDCKYFMGFEIYNEQPCVNCSYKKGTLKEPK